MIILYVASQHIQEGLGAFFEYDNVVFNCEQETHSTICVRMGFISLSLKISVCQHSGRIFLSHPQIHVVFVYSHPCYLTPQTASVFYTLVVFEVKQKSYVTFMSKWPQH